MPWAWAFRKESCCCGGKKLSPNKLEKRRGRLNEKEGREVGQGGGRRGTEKGGRCRKGKVGEAGCWGRARQSRQGEAGCSGQRAEGRGQRAEGIPC